MAQLLAKAASNYTIATQPGNFTPRCLSRRNKNIYPVKDLYMTVYITYIHNSQKPEMGRGQDRGRVERHAHPLPQTQQKKHIYRINDSHKTATNRWQTNLNSNNGKKFVTLLGRTGEKRRVREGESELDGRSERELRRRK